ncbi:MAG: GTPase HflX, partial [Fusobacteriaceae bacterium]
KGNIDGIKEFILKELETIKDMKVEKGILFTEEIVSLISAVSSKINREINVAIDRRGNVIEISIGDSNTVKLPVINASERKLSGVRIIHTHPSGAPNLSSIDISALIKLKLDVIVSLGIQEEKISGVGIGFCKIVDGVLDHEQFVFPLEEALEYNFLDKIENTESELRKREIIETDEEIAILVGTDTEESLDELAELARACDIKVVDRMFQKKSRPDPAYFIGSGKAKELSLLEQVRGANLLIFDEELSGLQIKNLEEITGSIILDRTSLILEIFARRARTRESKIQVELAQLKYRSQRLIGIGISMSRIGGAGQTKGAGEKKLELDRRRIKENIQDLKSELEEIRKSRGIQRERREESGIPKISLAGYTNAGKSSLRNIIVELFPGDNSSKKEEVFAENLLFATLDTTTRSIILPDKRIASLTDTVGFVRKLPHDLVDAFKSTLEEVIFSDMIIHVVDSSSPTVRDQIHAVENVLAELKADNKPIILALNKIDITPREVLDTLKDEFKNKYQVIEISAKENKNLELLLNTACELLPKTMKRCEFLIPYSETSVNAYLHRNSIIELEEFESDGAKVIATVNSETFDKCKKFVIKEL